MNSNNECLTHAIADAIKICSIKEDRFVSVVADYAPQHGFTLEEPQKSILKALCADSNMQEVVSKKGKIPNLNFEIKIILNHITTSKGYQEGLVFDILKHLLKGAGCKTPSNDVGIINPMPSVSATSSHHTSTQSRNNPTKHFVSSSTNKLKRITWLNDRRDTVCLILVALYFIGLIGLIITYFIGKKWEAFEWITAGSVIAFCICRFDVVLNKNHSKFWNWTWWICIAGGVLIGMLYETTGERTHKVVEKTEQNQPKKVRKKGNAKVKVSIVNAWLEHNVDNTLAIHCIFTVENAIGRTLDVVCTFQETGGRIRKKDLKDKNNEYCDFDGNVAVSYGSIFIEKEKQKMNLALYIPYPELHLTPSDIFLGKEVPHFINCLVKVIDTENESKTLDETNLHFTYWYGNSEDIN